MRKQFNSRDEVVEEILGGSHAHNLEGYECPRCGRIHVRVMSPMFTPLSGNPLFPPGVVVDVDDGWPRPDDEAQPVCPTDGIPMSPLTR